MISDSPGSRNERQPEKIEFIKSRVGLSQPFYVFERTANNVKRKEHVPVKLVKNLDLYLEMLIQF